ncbi:MAG: ABC transporter ATP-binding protein [Lentisphaerae bacterium]|nr:ABC transporter ATP-binding protein [Lentisphaerota bacterium]
MNKSKHLYFRLLGYLKPYWFRLTVGLIAGLLVGGSLFVSLLMLPQMIGAMSGSETKAVQKQLSAQSVSPDSELQITDPQLAKMLDQARSAAEKFHLPIHIEGVQVTVSWPRKFSFCAVSPDGRVAWQLFSLYAVLFVLVWALKNIAHYIHGYCTRWVGIRVVADLRNELFAKLTGQSLKFYGNVDSGQLISRISNDVQALEYAVSHSVEDITNAPLQIIGCLAAVIVACRDNNSYMLLIMLIVCFPVLLIPINILSSKIRKIYRRGYKHIAEVTSRMREVFFGIKAVKAYHTEDYETLRFKAANRKYIRRIISGTRYRLLVSPLTELVVVIATVVFLLYSYTNGATVTQLAALLAPLLMAYRPIKDVSKVIGMLQQSMAAAERVFETLDVDMELPEKADAVELKDVGDGIVLENVTFSYDDRTILDNVSFTIPRGHVVAVVGETGSGKSTLANLIARFYDVSSGRITIGGVDVRDCTIASLRDMVGVVNQEPIIFNETIRENIAYGTPEATMENIESAAKLANAHNFIVAGVHPEGYDTIAGENGFKLSGGEKQRVTIARAILRNPPVLILDEATSALDNVTEKLVQEALDKAMKDRTVFVIAHRLSTIEHADCIIVLEHGKIAESGTHSELLAKGGIYCRLNQARKA